MKADSHRHVPPDAASIPSLRRIVHEHDVRWELWPENHVQRDGEIASIGYKLELYGTHGNGGDHLRHPTPGCEACREVFRRLGRVAGWIMPAKPHGSQYQVQAFDQALHYEAAADMRPEVRLTIHILHRSDVTAPVDRCETECVHEMKKRLRRLGARKGG